MIRALYTAASGMRAQQSHIDNIAHNMANVNTSGFKKAHLEFEDLVYQEARQPGSPTPTGQGTPTGLEIGLGTRAEATSRDFSSGSLRSTGAPLDLAIQGDGFFQVTMPDGTMAYTRAGNLHRDGQGLLVLAEGLPIQPQITIPANATSITVSKGGIVSVAIPGQPAPQQLGTLELATFQNPSGLKPMGGNLFSVTQASGEPQTGVPSTDARGSIAQGFVEDSNVSVVEEMVNMILGQRAYEASSKVIKAADEMLGQVNNLVR